MVESRRTLWQEQSLGVSLCIVTYLFVIVVVFE
jgi:hypothetical protein